MKPGDVMTCRGLTVPVTLVRPEPPSVFEPHGEPRWRCEYVNGAGETCEVIAPVGRLTPREGHQ